MRVAIRRDDLSLRGPIISQLFLRVIFAAIATLVVTSSLFALGHMLDALRSAPAAPVHNPFGLTLQESAPNTHGIGALIIIAQAQFYAALTASVTALKDTGTGIFSLSLVGFLYGIFHAAGPGHGKALISAYMLSRNRSLSAGLVLSAATALLQALVAIALVSFLAIVLYASTASINAAARGIEVASFAFIAAIGACLVWSKAGELASLVYAGGAMVESGKKGSFCELSGPARTREMLSVVFSAGIRPCSGAIILLVFSLSQGLFFAGIAGALAMALGTCLVTGTLASLAVAGKGLLSRAGAKYGIAGSRAVAGVELLAAAFVLSFGFILLAGLGISLPNMLD